MYKISPVQFILFLTVVSTAALLFNVDNTPNVSEFDEWKKTHQIEYQTEFQTKYRRTVFYENKIIMMKHNANPLNSYKMGLNQFSAMTDEEFKQMYLSDIQGSATA